MSEPAQEPTRQAVQVSRIFEQPSDALSFYSDVVQVLATGNEVVLQFYETIPNAPGASGQIEGVRSRLRATAIVHPAHAMTIGQLLIQHANTGTQPIAHPTHEEVGEAQ